jgi:hypothetical protein
MKDGSLYIPSQNHVVEIEEESLEKSTHGYRPEPEVDVMHLGLLRTWR